MFINDFRKESIGEDPGPPKQVKHSFSKVGMKIPAEHPGVLDDSVLPQ